MKKQVLWLLSLIVISSMLAVACAPVATQAPPAAEQPAEQPTVVPAPTEPAMEEPTAEPAPTEAAAPEAAEPKILRVRLYSDIQNLDPAFQVSENDTMVANSVMSGLVRYCANSYDICNDLAESIEQSADGLEVTFKLKEGVQWHNGYGEVTTEDVKYSFERFIDPELDAVYADDWAALDHVEIIDKYNGKIILKEPFAPLWHSTLPVQSGTVICKKYVEEVGLEKFATNIIGSGPYIFAEWRPQEMIVLKKNPDYFGPAPIWDEIQMIPIDDDKAAEVALEAGDLDWSRISIASTERFKGNSDFLVWQKPSLRYAWIALNLGNEKLKDINVRKAIIHAIDVPSILAATYLGQVEQAYALVPPGLVGYWADAPHYERDVEKAKEYMAKAGLETLDLRLDMEDTTEYRTWGEIAQQNLKEIGINLELNPMESSAYWTNSFGEQAVTNNELLTSNYSMNPDPAWATMWFTCDQVTVWNTQSWCSEEYDELHRKALVTVDDKEREQIYIEMQKLWDEAAQTIWITYGVQTYAYSPKIKPATTPHGQPQYYYFEPVE
ncbi:MAG: ABC transporter substrate-binding protein [Chloroflexota bacterium]